jgi:CRISPR-associated protein Cas5t
MLQNAINRYYDEKLWQIKVSIHGGFESYYWNYQLLIKGEVKFKGRTLINQDLPLYGEGLKAQRTPVYQQELFNGHLYLFLKGQEELINEIKEYLEKPKKVLSLGRSEDIIFIRDIRLYKKEDIITEKVDGDIKLTFPTYIRINGFPINMKKYPIYSIPSKIIFKNSGTLIKNKSEISKSTEREVEFENVIYTGYEYSILLEIGKTLNVEVYKVGDDKEIKIIEDFGWL